MSARRWIEVNVKCSVGVLLAGMLGPILLMLACSDDGTVVTKCAFPGGCRTPNDFDAGAMITEAGNPPDGDAHTCGCQPGDPLCSCL